MNGILTRQKCLNFFKHFTSNYFSHIFVGFIFYQGLDFSSFFRELQFSRNFASRKKLPGNRDAKLNAFSEYAKKILVNTGKDKIDV
jgi:hypothetical protein